ncbi:hypothetical protein [Lactobacillus sp. PSON]|uniref:hypothetical protein n=1 Tax=Lactobacillus sp. PSON TaxID=3455454 RepID=UPI0040425DD4
MKKFTKLIFLPFILIILLSACSKPSTKKKTTSKLQIYPVKVTNIHGHRGDIIISGTSKAPNNSQIVVKQTQDSGAFMNHAYSSHIGNAKAAKVKNGQFKVLIPSAELSSISNGNLKAGDNYSLIIMAIDGTNKRIGVVTNKKLIKQIENSKIAPYKFKLTNKMTFNH